jgi:hypothetical protein
MRPVDLRAYDAHYQLMQALVDAARAVAALPLELMAGTCDRMLLTGTYHGPAGPVPMPGEKVALQRAVIDAALAFRGAVAAVDTAATPL